MKTWHSTYLPPLLLALLQQVANAESLTLPDGEVPVLPVEASPAPAVAVTTAEVWNKSGSLIKVIQKGNAPQELKKDESFQSQTYPEKPINIEVPAGSVIKFITVTGQRGSCTVSTCIYVQ
ncbi:hypothetical protein [Pseudomonas sp. NPDC089534]|uniref:hypothetical protein n=1 Tax=Pseudomonas sp. NPDC089534 TaxID=3364468 RepID=UPI00381D5835